MHLNPRKMRTLLKKNHFVFLGSFFLLFLLITSFSVLQKKPPLVSDTALKNTSSELGIAESSPLGDDFGLVVPASCPSDLHDMPTYGQACTTTANSCGMTIGRIQCDGSCAVPVCPTASVSVSPDPVAYGANAYFTLASTNADYCQVETWNATAWSTRGFFTSGTFTPGARIAPGLNAAWAYCWAWDGTRWFGSGWVSKTFTVSFPGSAVSTSISASPNPVPNGSFVDLIVSSTNATSCPIVMLEDPAGEWQWGVNNQPPFGTYTVPFPMTVTGNHTASAFCGKADPPRPYNGTWSTTIVTVDPPPSLITATITATGPVAYENNNLWEKTFSFLFGQEYVARASGPDATITLGQNAQITWSSLGAATCSINGPLGFIAGTLNGTYRLTGLTVGTHTYTITCRKAGSSNAVDSVSVVVSAAAAPGTPAALHLCPTGPTVGVSTSQQFSAWYTPIGTSFTTCSTPNGSDVASSATWSSSSPPNVTVNSTGLATGVASGSATITASYSGVNDATTVSVTCTPTDSCGNHSAQAETVCTGDTFPIDNGCGTTLNCPGNRYCNYNWKEVAP